MIWLSAPQKYCFRLTISPHSTFTLGQIIVHLYQNDVLYHSLSLQVYGLFVHLHDVTTVFKFVFHINLKYTSR